MYVHFSVNRDQRTVVKLHMWPVERELRERERERDTPRTKTGNR